jgi:tartrate-resistant acid phosphatase type 5
LKSWFLFDRAGVPLALAGCEHNFQVSVDHGRTYVVSGAGGKVREDLPEGFIAARTVAWSGQSHLVLAEVDGAELRLTPMSGMLPDGRPHLMGAQTPTHEFVRPPFVVSATEASSAPGSA